MPDLFGPRLGATARLEWAAASESFTAYPIDVQRVYDPISNETVDLDRRYRFQSDIPVLRLDLLGSYSPGERWRFGLGGWLGYRYSGTFSQRDTIVGASGFLYPDGTSGRSMDGGERATLAPLSAGLVAGIGCRLLSLGRFSVIPEFSFRAEFTSPVQESSRRTYSAGLGLAVQLDPLSVSPPSLPPVPKPDDMSASPSNAVPSSPPPVLEAHIDLYSLNATGVRSDSSVIVVEEALHRSYTPFLPVVFFDREAAAIPSRYVVLTPDRIGEFSLESFASLDAIGINHNALNVIGRRMLANPDASVTLYGERSGDEPSMLAERRAAAVRDYLRDVWGIAADRLQIRSEGAPIAGSSERTAEGRAENRRVVIVSTASAVTAPVAVERVARRFDPPMVRMKPTIVAGAGIRNWSITIRHAGVQVAHYSNLRPDGDSTGGIASQIVSDRIDSVAAPLVAELLVEDSTGHIAAARDELPLGFTGLGPAATTRLDRVEYIVPGFQENESDLPTRADIERVVRAIGRGAVVSVSGRIDRRRETKDRLAVDRARAVAEAVGRRLDGDTAHDLEITVGEDTVTDDGASDLPEERMAARSVRVVIERPSFER
jgi:hypothetical protein